MTRGDRAIAAALLALGFALGAVIFLPYRHGAAFIPDEFVYFFQAKTLASGRLTLPSPPLPEFFEAAHLLVVPRLTARYFPGQALALLLPMTLGVAWALPCLTLGLTAALVFLISRRAAVPSWAAALGALCPLAAPELLRLWVTYLSQPSAALWVMLGVFTAALLEQRATAPRAVVLGACVAMATLTRPFTGVTLGAAALLLAVRLRPRIAVLAAAAIPIFVSAALMLSFSRQATGSFTTAPWALYAAQYTPEDGPGFGAVSTSAPLRALPPHLESMRANFAASRARHVLSRMPAVVVERLEKLTQWLPSWWLVPAALLGLLAARRLWFALTWAAIFFTAQLLFHPKGNYYLIELAPIMALLAGAGAARIGELLPPRRGPRISAALLAVAAFVPGVIALPEVPRWAAPPVAGYDAIERALEPVRRARGLVFLRYPPGWSSLLDVTYNEPDLEHAPLVRALDLGARNAELRKHFPGRPAFLLDLENLRLRRLP